MLYGNKINVNMTLYIIISLAFLHLLTFKTPTINPYISCIFLLSFSSYNTFYYMFLSGYSYNMTEEADSFQIIHNEKKGS